MMFTTMVTTKDVVVSTGLDGGENSAERAEGSRARLAGNSAIENVCIIIIIIMSTGTHKGPVRNGLPAGRQQEQQQQQQ